MGAACVALAASAHAQQPQADSSSRAPRATSRAPDSLRRDSTALPDSLKPDSLEPLLPELGPPAGPQPAGQRIVFDQDYLNFSGVMSLGELLERIPGVFLVRAGWFGHPEAIAYRGQGPGAIELYQDGYLLEPLGQDSAGFDLGRIDLGNMRRVEVEVLPTVLRVYLISDVKSPRRAHTEASFGTGDASTNGYRLRYQNRFEGGAGIGVGATYSSTAGGHTSPASVSQFNLSARGTWAPSDRVGVEYQMNSYTYQRDALAPSASGSSTRPFGPVDVRRSDMFVRFFSATREDGMGLRLDALLGSSTYSDTSAKADTSVSQAALDASFRAGQWSAEAWSRLRDGRVPLDVGGRLAVSPLRQLTLSGLYRRRDLLGVGGTTELVGDGELSPLPFLALRGMVRWRRLDDSAVAISPLGSQDVMDWSGGLALTTGLFSIDAGLGSHDALATPALGAFRAQLPGIVGGGATFRNVSYEIRPRRWFTISGWWHDPGSDSVPFEPRNHSLTRFTVRSRFLPKLRRGVFDLMAQVEVESWGKGIAGRDSSGSLVRLPGVTTYNYTIEFRLVGAIIYWSMRNALFARYAIIPGFEQPRALNLYGVRWQFTN